MRKTYYILIVALIALLFHACDEKEDFQEGNLSKMEEQFIINEEEFRQIAGEIETNNDNVFNSRSTTTSKKLLEYRLVKENEIPYYYIINYEGGGFIILAADKRSEPLLAFSLESTFPLNEKDIPDGVLEWQNNAIISIHELKNNKSAEDYVLKRWEEAIEYGIRKILPIDPPGELPPEVPDDPNDPVCDTQIYSVSPLLSTVWHQGVGFNDYAPYLGCSERINGKAAAGCVAIAGGQIMRYFEHPLAYDYEQMHDTLGSNEASRLIGDIGTAVGMNYECEASGASTTDLARAFKNDFSYSSADYETYNSTALKNELKAGYPVIIRGESSDGGHAWVCDGYNYYVNPCGANLLYFHMNWGWGTGYNGYYGIGGDLEGFNNNNKMIYRIRK